MPRAVARKVVTKVRAPKSVTRSLAARTYVSADFLRHVYITLLLNFPRDQVRKFWSQVPLKDGVRLLAEEELYECFWRDDEKFELSYQIRVLEQLEVFLREVDFPMDQFVHLLVHRVGGSRYLSAKSWLYELNPYMHTFFGDIDARQYLMQIWNELPQNFGADVEHRLLTETEDGKWRVALMGFRLRHRPLDTLNYSAWVLPWLMNAPNIIGMPSYEKGKVVVDQRHPEALLARGSLLRRGPTLFQGDREVGKYVSFVEVLNQYDLSLEDLDIEEPAECLKVIAPIFDDAGQILFAKGSICSAPIALVEIKYHANLPKSKNPFAVCIDMLEWPDDKQQEHVIAAHVEMLNEVRRKLEFTFYNDEESISVNGRHIIKNVPARILRKIVTSYVQKGQTHFEYREFKRDTDICMDPANPNFEVRLQRLMDKIREDFPELCLGKERRGHFSFKPNFMVTFKEIN